MRKLFLLLTFLTIFCIKSEAILIPLNYTGNNALRGTSGWYPVSDTGGRLGSDNDTFARAYQFTVSNAIHVNSIVFDYEVIGSDFFKNQVSLDFVLFDKSVNQQFYNQPVPSSLLTKSDEFILPAGVGQDYYVNNINTVLNQGDYWLAFELTGTDKAPINMTNIRLDYAHAPEPASLALLSFGLIGAGIKRIKK